MGDEYRKGGNEYRKERDEYRKEGLNTSLILLVLINIIYWNIILNKGKTL